MISVNTHTHTTHTHTQHTHTHTHISDLQSKTVVNIAHTHCLVL